MSNCMASDNSQPGEIYSFARVITDSNAVDAIEFKIFEELNLGSDPGHPGPDPDIPLPQGFGPLTLGG